MGGGGLCVSVGWGGGLLLEKERGEREADRKRECGDMGEGGRERERELELENVNTQGL